VSARRRIDPGALRDRLMLQTPATVPDGLGGAAEGWTDVGIVDAAIVPRAARSRGEADRAAATLTHVVTMRRRAGVTHGMRFVKDGRALVIRTVRDPDETGRYLECGVEEAGA